MFDISKDYRFCDWWIYVLIVIFMQHVLELWLIVFWIFHSSLN